MYLVFVILYLVGTLTYESSVAWPGADTVVFEGKRISADPFLNPIGLF